MARTLYHIFPAELGWLGIAGTEGNISRLELPMKDRTAAEEALLGGISGDIVETEHDFSGEAERLAAYFEGERVKFTCEVDASSAGLFDIQVWKTTREIGYGESRSYGWIADHIGRPRAARAVGQAMGRNPVPIIIPCHRVLRADGSIGGFGCGLEWKYRLLAMEGHDINRIKHASGD